MSAKDLEMYDEFINLISEGDALTGNHILEILKKYSSTISVFDMMDFTSQVIEENKYVQASYRNDSQKSYIESFLMRIKSILNDNNDYSQNIDRKSFGEAIEILETHNEEGTLDKKN